MDDHRALHIFKWGWPLAVFSVPGMLVFWTGVWVGWNGVIVHLNKTDPANYVGMTGLTVLLCVMGMLSFFAGLILSALYDLGTRLAEAARPQARGREAKAPARNLADPMRTR
jgi:hypothetical protein